MIFEQLFDTKSSTYTYIISSGKGREALIIDPVIEHSDEYLKILKNLELKLVKVIDTHIHADHISGLNELNKRTNCTRIMGEKSKSEVVDIKLKLFFNCFMSRPSPFFSLKHYIPLQIREEFRFHLPI